MARRFAPVAPVSVLKHLARHNCLGDYHLVLAHNVVEQADEFWKLFHHRRDITVIVDNSVIELGHPVAPQIINEATQVFERCGFYRSNIVTVLPDVLLDMRGTVSAAAKALAEWREAEVAHNLMFVPQGQTYEEVIECAEAFQHVQEITWIGVAKNLTKILGTRETITKTLQSIFPSCKFHMLGFSRNIIDDILCTRLPGVEGIDSSVPLRIPDPISFNTTYPPRGDWWKEGMQGTQRQLENVRQVRKWLSY